MPSFTGGGLGVTWGFVPHEDGWADSYNLNFQRLDAVVQLNIISFLDTPPGSPAAEDRYIVEATATGAWAGQENKIAVWTKKEDPDSRAWVFITPDEGWVAYNKDTGTDWRYDGVNWVEIVISSLPAGTNGQFLSLVAGSPDWVDLPIELPTPTTDGYVLTLVAGTAAWAAPTGGTGFDLTEGNAWAGDAAYTKGTFVTYTGKRYVASVDIAAPAGTPGLDGSAFADGAGATLVVTGLDTTGTADTICVVAAWNHDATTVNSITSTSGLTFVQRASQTRTNISGHRLRVELWTAPVVGALTNEDVTITLSNANPTDSKAVVFGVFGGDIGDPLDANADSLKTASGDRTAPGVTAFSTSNADDLLIFIAASDSDGSTGLVANTAPATWTLLNYQGNVTDDSNPNVVNLAVSTKLVSATQSAIAISDGGDPSVWGAIAAAVKASGAANLSPADDPQWIVTDEGTDALASADLDGVLGTTEGSIAVRGAALWSGLAPGAENETLSIVAGVPAWSSAGSSFGNLVLIASTTADNTSTTIAFAGLTGDAYLLVIENLIPATAGADISIQFGEGATPTYQTSGYSYAYAYTGIDVVDAGTTRVTPSSEIAKMAGVRNVAGVPSGTVRFNGLSQAKRHAADFVFILEANGNSKYYDIRGSGIFTGDTNAITAVRVISSSGNLSSGRVSLYRMTVTSGAIGGTEFRLEAPANGATIALDPADEFLVLNPAASIATLTVTMPAAVDGQRIDIATRQRIDALTITGDGSDAVDWPDGELPQYGKIGLLYVASLTTWVMA